MLSLRNALLAASLVLSAVAANTGKATFFTPGEGACGHLNTAADHIVAVSSELFKSFPGAGANPNTNPICNKQIKINFKGKSATATVTDQCPGCAGKFDLDMSPAVFDQLGDESQGVLQGIVWDFA